MSDHRITPPPPPADGSKVHGPASYFPSIEKNYGRPIQDWLDLVDERFERLDGEKHMQVVAWLKAEHGFGHGHANALVGYVRNARAPRDG